MKRLAAAIVAGGPGLRLAAINPGRPKALAQFDGGTLIDHQIDRVLDSNPVRIVVLAHHGADALEHHIRARTNRQSLPPIDIRVEPQPLGTAGALHTLPSTPNRWLVRNVDHVSDVDMVEFARTEPAPCTAVVTHVEVPIDEGVVTIENGRLTDWQERPLHRVRVTTGLYLFEREAIGRVLSGSPIDMPDLVRALMPEVVAWNHAGTWFDAGTPERLRAAERWWTNRRAGRARITELSS